MSANRSIQRGFSLITAIFLLVVIASLGAMMATFFAAQQQSVAIDTLGSRAYQAARAGAEWGIFKVVKAGGAGCIPATSLSLPTGSPFSSYTIVVSCSATSAVEGVATTWVYDLAVASSGVDGAQPGDLDYVERSVRVGVWEMSNGASAVVWK